MRKAIQQISEVHPTPQDAMDSLAGLFNLKDVLGIVSGWVCGQNRTHIIATAIDGIEHLTAGDLQPGQRLVWLPDL